MNRLTLPLPLICPLFLSPYFYPFTIVFLLAGSHWIRLGIISLADRFRKEVDRFQTCVTLTNILMKRNISQKLILLSFITLPGVGLIGYADYKTNQKLVSSGQLVQHTQGVIYQSDNLYALSKDIEIQTQG